MSSTESPPPRPSGRKGSRKVRTGCITCKIRKVKCDEGKPSCMRCVKTGRKCDGYLPSPRASPRTKPLSPIPGFESVEELQVFDYYRRRSIGIFSGTVDSSFWGGAVLKMSISEPAVRHAILAVGSLHRCMEEKNSGGSDLGRHFAFREYSKAISCLREWSSHGEISALPLLVCVLFVCFEFLADRQTASQMHICQGRQILSEMQDGQSPTLSLIKQSLVPVYTRLSLASFLYGSRPATIPRHLNTCNSVPVVFTSLDEARRMLYTILDRGIQFTARAMPAIYDPTTTPEELNHLYIVQQQLLSDLARWNSAFIVFSSIDSQTQTLTNSRDLIMLYYHASRVWVSTALRTDQIAYDSHLSEFASIISLATSILNSPSSSRPSAFSFETEVVAPVYWTATKCRHPLLRRAALKLLARDELRDRRENHWHVDTAIAVAIRVIEVEEGGMERPLNANVDPNDPLAGLNNFMKPDGRRPGVVRQRELDLDEFKVHMTEQPLGPAPTPSFADLSSDDLSDVASENYFTLTLRSSAGSSSTSPSPYESPSPVRIPPIETSNLEAPFSIPEFQRVKNVTIGPRENGGVWATFFEDPEPGKDQWKVTREFLAV